jgi:hypothetical protein
MTAGVREAIVLPGAFLTVLLLGGVRIGETTTIAPPSVYALVLGLLLVRIVVQSGVLAPERLVGSARSALSNVNGAIVLVAMWLAAAQVMALLIPAAGLPRILFGVFLLILLVNTAAAAPDRVRLLRSLATTFGALFLLKFVVLSELSTPGDSRLKRVLQALLEGITLGALVQPRFHAATGYVALVTVVLFLVSLFLLPARLPGAREVGLARRDSRRA